MGVSCVISIQSQLRKSIPRKKLVGRVVRRALTLILLGLVMNTDNNHNDLSKLRLPGVLQRFGLAYLAVGLLEALQLPRQFSAPPALMADLYSAPWAWGKGRQWHSLELYWWRRQIHRRDRVRRRTY